MNHAAMITVVSGLPRSGTSLAMQLLNAAGIPLFSDGLRRADAANQQGNYEAEIVKQLPADASWLPQAQGRAVKVVHQLLPALPAGYDYRVLVMERPLEAVLASQQRLLARLGRSGAALSNERLKAVLQAQLLPMERWLTVLPPQRVLRLDYGSVLREPARAAGQILAWLGEDAPAAERVARVAAVVEPALCHWQAEEAGGSHSGGSG